VCRSVAWRLITNHFSLCIFRQLAPLPGSTVILPRLAPPLLSTAQFANTGAQVSTGVATSSDRNERRIFASSRSNLTPDLRRTIVNIWRTSSELVCRQSAPTGGLTGVHMAHHCERLGVCCLATGRNIPFVKPSQFRRARQVSTLACLNILQ